MAWLGYILGGIALGAMILAIYEWRKGLSLREDIVLPTKGAKREDAMAATRSKILKTSDYRHDDFGSL